MYIKCTEVRENEFTARGYRHPGVLVDVVAGARGRHPPRDRSHCRIAPPLIRFTPDLLTYLVPLFLKRQCDRALRLTTRCAAAARRPGGAPQ